LSSSGESMNFGAQNYRVGHKKRATLLSIITFLFLEQLLRFLYEWTYLVV